MAKEKKPEPKVEKVERIYTIPLREKCRVVPRYKKTNKAIKTIKEFIARHMKVQDRDLSKVRIDKYLNEIVWFRGIRKPPIKIKVKAIKEGDIVRVELAEMPAQMVFKKARLEKRETKAQEKTKAKAPESSKDTASSETPSTSDSDEAKEKKKKESEKAKSGEEATAKLEKSESKQAKHQVGGKTKQPKRPQRKVLNK